MKQGHLYLIIISLLLTLTISAQTSEFGMNEKSYYAKVLRLGSAYTGFAEGLESINTNTAGLADMELAGILYSDAFAGPILVNKKPSYSLNLAFPISWNSIVLGASYNRLSLDVGKGNKWINSKMAIHAAKKLSGNLSVGLSFNYYRIDTRTMISTTEHPIPLESLSVDVEAYDASIGLLYKVNDPFNINVPNKIGIGLFIENLLSTKASYSGPKMLDGQLEDQHKYQQIRLGTSYEMTSSELKFNGLDFISMLFVFDAVFNTSNYEFLSWQPNYGIDITFFEVLSFSYGRENEIKIDESIYGSTSAYPVSRYGIGLNLPLQRMFGLSKEINAEINYCYSDWQKIDRNFLFDSLLDRRGLSFALSYQI